MLWIGRDVAWLRLGSCTDQVMRAAAAPAASTSNPSPASSRKRRTSAARIAVGNWFTRGMTRSIAGMLSAQSLNQPMQCLGRCFTVRDQREPNVACAGIAAARLLPREVTAGDHPDAGVPVKLDGRRLVTPFGRHIEPDTEAAGRTPVAVPGPENLIGQIELDPVEPAV